MTVLEFLREFGGLLILAWALIMTVKWRRERRRRRVLYSEYRVLQDAAITILQANKDLEQERDHADNETV